MKGPGGVARGGGGQVVVEGLAGEVVVVGGGMHFPTSLVPIFLPIAY